MQQLRDLYLAQIEPNCSCSASQFHGYSPLHCRPATGRPTRREELAHLRAWQASARTHDAASVGALGTARRRAVKIVRGIRRSSAATQRSCCGDWICYELGERRNQGWENFWVPTVMDPFAIFITAAMSNGACMADTLSCLRLVRVANFATGMGMAGRTA